MKIEVKHFPAWHVARLKSKVGAIVSKWAEGERISARFITWQQERKLKELRRQYEAGVISWYEINHLPQCEFNFVTGVTSCLRCHKQHCICDELRDIARDNHLSHATKERNEHSGQ